uniref:Sacsin/Nov domain-containing protein n=1 Tax=Neogobius melanostomus TaxID=47308 RepID=A0A8C6S4J9_9GOBI
MDDEHKKKEKVRHRAGPQQLQYFIFMTKHYFSDSSNYILRRYPDGGQILKELIQNADDAGATEVVFIHDDRSYGTENLWAEDLAKYQGPALYAYNNAQFTDADWKGIQNVARSVKRGDPNKVGRFGLGFNSVYHITDVTSIFSAGHLGMMDPQEKIFGDQKGGFLWSLEEEDDREALTTMIDQFQPFRDVVSLVSGQEWSRVIQEDQNFNGTLFRFPLRSVKSEISDNLYSSEKLVELFDSFIADAELSLLFLKNVSSVSLIHIDALGSVSTRLQVKSTTSQDVDLKSCDGVTEGLTQIKTITLDSEDSRETKWLVTSCTMKEGNVDELDYLAEKLKFLPRIDLAFPCDDVHTDCSKSRLCCFLPLPNNDSNKTGLPVYVNAYFGLTDNRRHIKWLEEDQRNDKHAIWNETLIKEVLPKTYLTILRDAIRLVQDDILPAKAIYNLWPDISQVQHKEKWYEVAMDVLSQLFSQDVALLSLAIDESQFITLKKAVLPCNGPTCETLSAIRRILVSCNVNLVTLSDSVAKAIKDVYPDYSSLKHVTPAFLRNTLRSSGVKDISDADRLALLEFVLSDEQYSELYGLQLLPRSDGSFKSFTDREEDTVLIDSKEFPRYISCFGVIALSDSDLKSPVKVVRFTQSHLPDNWKKTENKLVTWDVSSGLHPPLNWLQEFWRFLNCHCTELSSLIGLPVIPVNTVSSSQPVKLAK